MYRRDRFLNRRRPSVCTVRVFAALAVCCTACAVRGADDDAQATPGPGDDMIAGLEKSLTGATLVGSFTVTGDDNDAKLHSERYELATVRHLGNGNWMFQARIRYGDHDLTIPLTLPVKWAGDTPIITVDEMAFPGMGSYTARVMIYRDHYAGFWTGKDHGGHLFGTVQRSDEAEADDAASESADDADDESALHDATIQPAQLGAAKPAHAVGDVFLCGQPAAEDFAQWRARGIRTVVTLRSPGEIDWDEAAAVRAADMRFVSIPVAGAAGLTDDVFQRTRILLSNPELRPLALHCASSNRVGAVWLVHRVLDDGVDVDAATLEAQAAGLRSTALKERAEAYVRGQRAR